MTVLLNATMIGNKSGTGRYCMGVINGFSTISGRNKDVYEELIFFIPDGFTVKNLKCREINVSDSHISRIMWEQTTLQLNSSSSTIIHGLSFTLPIFYSGKGVLTVHDMAYKRYPETLLKRKRMYYNFVIDRSIRSADIIIAITEFTAAEISHFFPDVRSKIKVIYPGGGFLPNVTKEESEETKILYKLNNPYYLTVGTLEPRKNLEFMLSSYRSYLKEGGEIDLVIVGRRGWLDSNIFEPYQDIINQNKLHLLGYLSDKELASLYAESQALVFPSKYEGFGLPLLECWQMGTAAIIPNAHALAEIGRKAALYFEPGNEESLAECLTQLEDPVDLNIYEERGKERAKDFSWEKCAAELWETYKSL
ncbi:MAG: glycosyltransferase family 4 protein [Candidatus Coatesbacteria bacterium]|nr:glycosyltransferase family 4 protein [Candidatus Coatesbacteria bacterium]